MDMLASQAPAPARPAVPTATSSFAQTPLQPVMGGGMASPPPQQRPMGVGMGMGMDGGIMSSASPPVRSNTGSTTAASAKPSSNFDDLWSMSLGSSSSTSTGNKPGVKSMKDLEKEKAQTGIWSAQQKPAGSAAFGGSGGFGNFGTSTGSAGASGGDDLLL